MTFNNFAALNRWFMSNKRDGKNAPFWTLYSIEYGTKENTIARNESEPDMDKSFEWLRRTIVDASANGGVFKIMQVDVPKGNNPVGTIRYEVSPGTSQQNGAPYAIAGLPGELGGGAPAGYISEAEFDKRVADILAKRDLEDRIAGLEAQLANPPKQGLEALWEKLEGFLQTPVGMAIAAKVAGVAPGALAGMMHGTPDPGEAATDDDELDQMDAKLQHMAQTVGVSEPELVAKLYNFTQTQPDVARNLIAQL